MARWKELALPEQRVRLLNVAQIRYTLLGVEHLLRANCVDITVGPGMTTIVLLNVDLDIEADPFLVGRLVLSEAATITDACDTDYQSWSIATNCLQMLIQPFADEAIFLDPAYGQDDLPDDLAQLYNSLRASRGALVAHRRLMRTTPHGYDNLRKTHEGAVLNIQAAVNKLESQIASKEAKRDQTRSDARSPND